MVFFFGLSLCVCQRSEKTPDEIFSNFFFLFFTRRDSQIMFLQESCELPTFAAPEIIRGTPKYNFLKNGKKNWKNLVGNFSHLVGTTKPPVCKPPQYDGLVVAILYCTNPCPFLLSPRCGVSCRLFSWNHGLHLPRQLSGLEAGMTADRNPSPDKTGYVF